MFHRDKGSKNQNFYFSSFILLSELGAAAAEKAVSEFAPAASDYRTVDSVPAVAGSKEFSTYTARADSQFTLVLQKLQQDFMTPFDREDILALTRCQAELIHKIDRTQEYTSMIGGTHKACHEHGKLSALAEVLNRCCCSAKAAAELLENHKKPQRLLIHLSDLRKEMKKAEKECLFLRTFGSAVKTENALTGNTIVVEILQAELAQQLRDCCRAAAACGEVMETIVVKN